MKLIIATIALIIIAFCSYGQGVQSKEEFLNGIWPLINRDSGFTLSLYRNSYPLSFPKQILHNADIKKVIPRSILNELVSKSGKDTARKQWDCSKLSFANYIENDSFRLTGAMMRNGNICYSISRPIVSNNGKFVAISVDEGVGSLSETICTYLFEKKADGSWHFPYSICTYMCTIKQMPGDF